MGAAVLTAWACSEHEIDLRDIVMSARSAFNDATNAEERAAIRVRIDKLLAGLEQSVIQDHGEDREDLLRRIADVRKQVSG